MTKDKLLGDIIRRVAPAYATISAYNNQLALFLAQFNHIEVRVSEIIRKVLTLHNLPELGQTLSVDALGKQLVTLERLSYRNEYVAKIPVEEIRSLSVFRNQLAHGTFRIDHSDGSYATVAAKSAKRISPEDIEAQRFKANDIAGTIDTVWQDLLIDELEDVDYLFLDSDESTQEAG